MFTGEFPAVEDPPLSTMGAKSLFQAGLLLPSFFTLGAGLRLVGGGRVPPDATTRAASAAASWDSWIARCSSFEGGPRFGTAMTISANGSLTLPSLMSAAMASRRARLSNIALLVRWGVVPPTPDSDNIDASAWASYALWPSSFFKNLKEDFLEAGRGSS